jgi:hypothetical protein
MARECKESEEREGKGYNGKRVYEKSRAEKRREKGGE